MSIAKVELLFNEDAFRLVNLALASELFISSILDLHDQNLFVYTRPGWVEHHGHLTRLSGRNYIAQWAWHIDFASVLPAESGWCITLVSDLEGLLDGHLSIVAVLTELESEDLRGELEADGIGLSLH